MTTLPAGKRYRIKDSEFHFSVAGTGVELMTGLKGVTSLGDFDGMLFDFGCNFRPIMTSNGLQFPVDLAFILESGTIVEIKRLDPAYGTPQSATREDIFYVLEVPVGFFEEHNIAVGDAIDF